MGGTKCIVFSGHLENRDHCNRSRYWLRYNHNNNSFWTRRYRFSYKLTPAIHGGSFPSENLTRPRQNKNLDICRDGGIGFFLRFDGMKFAERLNLDS